MTLGRLKRLMLFLPPRHGKTEMVTVRYPVYRLAQNPEMRVIIGAYNQTLANKFSRKARKLARECLDVDRERRAAEEWDTVQGGGLRAVGVGAGITGQGGQLVIIDDPVKSREEANSLAYRERVWEWYRDDLYTRLEPGAAMILIMTRWHDDDLAGRILMSEDGPNWEILRLPAEAETQEERDSWAERLSRDGGQPDPLGREPGEALCDERYPLPELQRIRTVLGTPSYWALYQQAPQPPAGGMLKRHWFKIVGAAPAQAKRVRYWDKAGTADGGAWTAGALVARNSAGQFFIEDVVRAQLEAADRERLIEQTAALDARRGSVEIWVEQEPGSGGKESAQGTIRRLAGHVVYADRVTGDKATRAEPLAAQAEAKNVFLVDGKWNGAWLDEAASFPHGRYKDQIDATSGAFNKLAGSFWTGSAKW